MMEPGKFYYIISHAYYHYLAEVVEVEPMRVVCGRCFQVHGDGRSWTKFFRRRANEPKPLRHHARRGWTSGIYLFSLGSSTTRRKRCAQTEKLIRGWPTPTGWRNKASPPKLMRSGGN
jgi:hypothetical protein